MAGWAPGSQPGLTHHKKEKFGKISLYRKVISNNRNTILFYAYFLGFTFLVAFFFYYTSLWGDNIDGFHLLG